MAQLSPVRRLGGGLLIAAGVLIAGLAGTCTAVFGFDGLGPRGSMSLGDHLGMLALAMAFGAPTMLAGAGLVWAGARLGWPDRRPVPPRWRGVRRILSICTFILFAAVAFTAFINIVTAVTSLNLASLMGSATGVVLAAILFWTGRSLWPDPKPKPEDDVF